MIYMIIYVNVYLTRHGWIIVECPEWLSRNWCLQVRTGHLWAVVKLQLHQWKPRSLGMGIAWNIVVIVDPGPIKGWLPHFIGIPHFSALLPKFPHKSPPKL